MCLACWQEAPAPKARAAAGERWYYRSHRLVCSFCGSGTKLFFLDGSNTHHLAAHQSLRSRVRAELELALDNVPESCTQKEEKELKSSMKALSIKFGSGRGPRYRCRQDCLQVGALVARIHRTLERLLPEPSLREERRALLLALRALNVR